MTTAIPDDRPLILVTLSGGGWHRETARILEYFPKHRFRFAYVYGHCRGVHGAARLSMPHEGPRHAMHYLGPTRRHPVRFITNTLRFGLSVLEAFSIVRRLRPHAILALGTSMALPLFAVGKAFGARRVFVESLTRVRRLSLTGRLLYRLGFADDLYVQWPSLQQEYPKARFAGAVL